MTAFSGFAYAQTRIQSRYGERANANVWHRLHNIHDLGSYLQTAQQTPLRHWVLGLSSTHSSHDIELALRQKYRRHVDEVAGWMPVGWQVPMRWIKRLGDLPVLQYLAGDGVALEWMKSDPDIRDFTADDSSLRMQALQQSRGRVLLASWQQSGSMLPGWLSQWNRMRPRSKHFDPGLKHMEKVVHQQLHLQAKQQGVALPTDYELMTDQLRKVFRRYAFQPTAVCAYLVIVALDLHHLRSDLMMRLLFLRDQDAAQGLPE
jgi:hypothetical protein